MTPEATPCKYGAPAVFGRGVMRIRLNGEEREVSQGLTVTALLRTLGLDARHVAVERNALVVARATFEKTHLTEGDTVEIVRFVGGG